MYYSRVTFIPFYIILLIITTSTVYSQLTEVEITADGQIHQHIDYNDVPPNQTSNNKHLYTNRQYIPKDEYHLSHRVDGISIQEIFDNIDEAMVAEEMWPKGGVDLFLKVYAGAGNK